MELELGQGANADLLNLPLEKIESFILILEEREIALEENADFSQAARVREKINRLTELKISKMALNMKEENKQRIDSLREERENELNAYAANSDQQRQEIEEKGNQMLADLNQRHIDESQSFQLNFEENFPKQNPTSTKAILDLNKKLEAVIRKKDYDVAHKYKEEIERLTALNDKKWNEEVKAQKYNVEQAKISKRQTLEVNNLKSKIESILNEFNAKRNSDIEQIEKKYVNRERELMNELTCKGNAILSNSIKTVAKNDLTFNKSFNNKKKHFTSSNTTDPSMSLTNY